MATPTHDLHQLLNTAELAPALYAERRVDPALGLNWAIALDWSPAARYDSTVSSDLARDLYDACTSPRGGVLPWIEERW